MRSTAREEIVADLRRHGCCILQNIIPPSEVSVVCASVAATVREHTSLPLPNGYVTGLLRLDRTIAPYLTEPRIMAVCDQLLGDHFRISMLTGVINGLGIARGPMHADWPFNQNLQSRIRAPYDDVNRIVNLVTMWMLTDYTPENGGTLYVPGSHQRGRSPAKGSEPEPMAEYEDAVHLVGQAGDVGVFDARTWHAIAPNISGADRVAVIVRFAPWWINLNPLRPGHVERNRIVEEKGGNDSQVETISPAIFDTLPPALQDLVYHMVE